MKKPDLYQIAVIALTTAIVLATAFLIFNFSKGKIGKVSVKVELLYGEGTVRINGKDFGKTPINYADVKSTNVEVEINGDTNSYKTTINPSANTMIVLLRDLGVSDVFRSGTNTWLTKTGRDDALISFISPTTEDVSVIVDGVEVGKTPIKVSTKALLNHNDDEQYNVEFKKDGYSSAAATLKARKGYEITVSVDLFLNPLLPLDKELEGLPEGVSFYSFTNYDNAGYTNKQDWAKAINYWLKTRGPEDLGNNMNVEKFDYFIDDNGKVYNDAGNEIAPTDVKFESGMNVAYLGAAHEEGLSEAAQNALSTIAGKDVVIKEGGNEESSVTKVKIKPNSLGYLRVRSGAGRGNPEVAKVKVGDVFVVLEEANGWYKIEYEEGKEGWISGNAQYTEKIEPEKKDEKTDANDTEEKKDANTEKEQKDAQQ